MKLLFHIDLSLLNQRQKVSTEPSDLSKREAMLGDVDGLTGEMWGCGVAISGSGVAIDVYEMLLELNRANGRVDLQRRMKVSIVRSGERRKELGGPGAAVAAICRKALVDLQAVICGEGDEQPFAAHAQKIVVVLNAVEAVTVGYLILVDKNLVGAFEWRRNNEAAALVVQAGQDDWRRCSLFDAWQLRSLRGGPHNTNHRRRF